LIINAVGKDRLGIVSDITGMVIDAGGNVGDSQAAKLGPHFSLMMMVSVPTEQLTNLQSRLQSMPDMNATVFESKLGSSQFTPQIACKFVTCLCLFLFRHPVLTIVEDSASFTLEGADHPGIVHKITAALAKAGLSIDKMETDQEIAPYGGSMLFKMRGVATAAAPLAAGFDAHKIKQEMEELGDTLNCEVTLTDVVDDRYDSSFYAG
jgi:glycine cleavage system transcriptional repressor